MKVTVAVLTYNEQANIPDVLGSLEAQTLPREAFEVLIVDNGSTDQTLEAIGRASCRERVCNDV